MSVFVIRSTTNNALCFLIKLQDLQKGFEVRLGIRVKLIDRCLNIL